MVAGPLITTKVRAPLPRQGAVDRGALVDRLRRASSKLALISAPAGFGKTSLLAAYTAGSDRRVAWLALDQSDNDPIVFWSHVMAALQAVASQLGADMMSGLEAAAPPNELILATLLNEFETTDSPIDLVLDDYHVIDRAEVHEALAFLLEHQPAQMRLLISTRSDPPLPLSRLRAQGELMEVRARDLRFSVDEAMVYLNRTMMLDLSPADVAALVERTEGWIAGLQLAALSIEGRDDPTPFIAAFAGNDRYILDYLIEEVLDRQSPEVRCFLRATCVLERLCGPLCDAVTGTSGGDAMLRALERANLFVVPLDSRREWYRYHHLFADVLQTHFGPELLPDLPVLHQRASGWFAAQGATAEAVHHALSGSNVEQAAALIEGAIPELTRTRQEATLRAWLEALPDEVVRRRPLLGIGLVGSLVAAGAFDGVEERLQDVEQALTTITGAAVHDQLLSIPGEIELYRAALAQVRGDMPAVVTHAQRSIDLAPADEHFGRAGAHGFLGIAHWTQGELEAAVQSWTSSRDGLRRAGRISDVFGTSIAIADINLALGRLRAAARVYEDALQLGTGRPGRAVRGAADAHVGLSEVYRLGGDLDLASQHLARSQELGEAAGLPQFPHRWRVALALLRQAGGDAEGALDLLDEAERVYVPDFFPPVRPIAAMKARVLIRQGRLREADRWGTEAGVGADDKLSYLREFEHITLARLLLAAGDDRGMGLLDRLLVGAEAGARAGSMIEILVLQALVRSARDADDAVKALEQALTLAAPEGVVQVFVDEGEDLLPLLRTAARAGNRHAREVLGLLDQGAGHPSGARQGYLEPLSERERDVLRLLRSELGGPEIARALGISLNTLRTHTRNIYDKFGVKSRRAAVQRAVDLGL